MRCVREPRRAEATADRTGVAVRGGRGVAAGVPDAAYLPWPLLRPLASAHRAHPWKPDQAASLLRRAGRQSHVLVLALPPMSHGLGPSSSCWSVTSPERQGLALGASEAPPPSALPSKMSLRLCAQGRGTSAAFPTGGKAVAHPTLGDTGQVWRLL